MTQKLIVDCTAGTEEYVDLTAEEEADMEARAAASIVQRDEGMAAVEAAAAAKASGEAKLADLGLSADEIAALVG